MGKQRNKTKASPHPPAQSKGGWKDNLGTKVLFAVLGGIIVKGADVLDNLNRLPDAVTNSAHRAYEWWAIDHDWSGKWTDEGCVDCPTPDVFITVDLTVRNGIASGMVETPPMIGRLPYPHLMIDGRKIGDQVTGIFYDYVGGKKTKFADFSMTASGDDRLIKVSQDPLGIFPKEEGDLFKGEPYVEAVVPTQNK